MRYKCEPPIQFLRLILMYFIQVFLFSLIAFTLFASSIHAATHDQNYELQRKIFSDAEHLLRTNRQHQYKNQLSKLRTYPLLPYLIYQDYKKRLSYISSQQITTFSDRYADTPLAKKLEREWLINLSKHRRWDDFLNHYKKSNSTSLQCIHLRALYHTGEKKRALSLVKPLWLVAKSQPKPCDSLFKTWQSSQYFSADYAWQRFQLAMKKGKYQLARYLLRLTTGQQKRWAEQWYQLRRHPERIKRMQFNGLDNEINKDIVRYAIKRWARYDAPQAWRNLRDLSQKYQLSNDDITKLERRVALASLLQREELENPEIAKVISHPKNGDLQEWRIRAALTVGDWQSTQEWLGRLTPAKQALPSWQYWQARTAEMLAPENPAGFKPLYQALAQQRHYYGFLAADKIKADYQLNHQSITTVDAQVATLRQLPAFIRARELLLLNKLVDARREWRNAIKQMNSLQQVQAAKLAAEWGWHDRAIHTVAQTPYRDDIELRFPLAHRQQVLKQAKHNSIDPSWVMSVIRQESAFMPDAKSNRGALGLMQIMPRTGKEIGRLIKSPLHNTANLLQSDLNIKFGSAYLKKNMQRLQQNMVAATASYNAGYGNVRKWLPKEKSITADRWVESIRFSETRNYVQNIMAYIVIYDQRLGRPTIRISERMPDIQPRKK